VVDLHVLTFIAAPAVVGSSGEVGPPDSWGILGLLDPAHTRGLPPPSAPSGPRKMQS